MITDEALITKAILDEFAGAFGKRKLPRDALKQAADRWPEVSATLLEMLEDLARGAELTERTDAILFLGIYLMAQLRETRAFRPVCMIAADGDVLEQLIGDGVTEDLSLILARTYDGDQAPLRDLIEAEEADEFSRDAAISTLAWLTASGRIDRNETASYLRDLHATLRPQGESWVWVGWQEAIARLGLEELVPLVEQVFERDWIDPMALSLHHFHEDLRAALQATDPTETFSRHDKDDGRLDDIARHMSDWSCFKPEEKRVSRPMARSLTHAADQPVRNPYRDVGRNDSCPCGSGKKFKKCCLGKVNQVPDPDFLFPNPR
jgi:hypothetical protein